MATNPAIAPLSVIPKLGFPSLIQVVAIAPTAPAAAAMLVTITTADAATESSPPQASCEPPLKPNHPNHRINTPRAPNKRLCPGITFDFPSTYLPSLGPTIHAPTSAAHPPTEWTIEDPAKSIKPRLANQPSPFHCHPPEIG